MPLTIDQIVAVSYPQVLREIRQTDFQWFDVGRVVEDDWGEPDPEAGEEPFNVFQEMYQDE